MWTRPYDCLLPRVWWWSGTPYRWHIPPASVLRIETTTNDVSFFKHDRRVEHRKGPASRGLAPVKQSIYNLFDLREVLLGCTRRYIAHLSALDDFSAGIRA